METFGEVKDVPRTQRNKQRMTESKTIIISEAPLGFLKRRIIRGHFARFGTIVQTKLLEGSCIVSFDKVEQASDALNNGFIWKSTTLKIGYLHNYNQYNFIEENLYDELNWYHEESEPIEKIKANDITKQKVFGKGKTDVKPVEVPPKKMLKLEDEEDEKPLVKLNDTTALFKPCLNLSDKLNILEERDRQLRLKLEKVTRLEKAAVIKGICSDMCPEKERILRDVRGIVSSYEANASGSMDHSKAVKEYARSSADKEEPLAHELRPQPVLTMTMTYLLDQIISRIDEGEDNFANWYDFCWGRLRAIRKDIIQQQLSDLETVTIIEQCARFHIVCYDRLWGMSKSHFDDKINTENLVNCLQSLMHMYQDLHKEDIACPNEAEFIGYLVLLELNSGFLMSEYSRYSPTLQLSEMVKETVRIHLAYNNNMFSNYFKFTQQTTYLNACLMQRFFHHLRVNALEIIIKAHCVPNKISNISIQFLTESLKFDNYEDCITFCASCGLLLTKGDKYFKVSRNGFNKPDYLCLSKNSSRLVTSKRIPIVEAVLGENSPPLVLLEHKVHSSFSVEGTLNRDAVDASDQEEKMLRDVVERKLFSRFKAARKKSVSPQALSDISPFKFNVVDSKDSSSAERISVPIFSEKVEDSISSEDVSYVDNDSDFDQYEEEQLEEEEEFFEEALEEEEDKEFSDVLINKKESFCSSPFGEDSTKQFEKDYQTAKRISTFSLTSVSSTNIPKFVKSFSTEQRSFVPDEYSNSVLALKEHKMSPIVSITAAAATTTTTTTTTTTVVTPMKPSIISSTGPTLTNASAKPLTLTTFTSIKTMPPATKSEILLSSSLEGKETSTLKDIKGFYKKQKVDMESAYLSKLRKNLSKNMKNIFARKYLKVWREKVKKIQDQKQLESILNQQTSISNYLNSWGKSKSSRQLFECLTKRLKNRKKNNILVQILLHSDLIDKVSSSFKKIGRRLRDKLGEKSISYAHNWGNISQPSVVFWKLIFSLPPPLIGGSTFPVKLKNWCKKAFCPNGDENSDENLFEMQVSSSGVPVFIKISIVEGLSDENLKKCSNLSSLIIIRGRGWETVEETHNRLSKILSFTRTPIPVTVLNVGFNLDLIEKPPESLVTYFNQILWTDSGTILSTVTALVNYTPMYNIKVKPFCSLIDITIEKVFDLIHQDIYINEELGNSLKNPNKVIKIYNKLIGYIEREIKQCHSLNFYGTANEFKEKYSHLNIFPDNCSDETFENSISLRCSGLKLNEIKWPFNSLKEFLNFLKKYLDNINCISLLLKLIRYINPPDDLRDSEEIYDSETLMDCLNNVNWFSVIEMIVKQMLTSNLLTFKVVYRENELNEYVNTHWWIISPTSD